MAYGAAAVSTAQAVGDELRMKTPRPARTLEQTAARALWWVVGRHHCRASDGGVVPEPCYRFPTVVGLICLVTPSTFPGECPSLF